MSCRCLAELAAPSMTPTARASSSQVGGASFLQEETFRCFCGFGCGMGSAFPLSSGCGIGSRLSSALETQIVSERQQPPPATSGAEISTRRSFFCGQARCIVSVWGWEGDGRGVFGGTQERSNIRKQTSTTSPATLFRASRNRGWLWFCLCLRRPFLFETPQHERCLQATASFNSTCPC